MAVRFGLDTVAWGNAEAGATVINATPLGMAGETLPPGVVDGAGCLLDLAYGAEPTPAVAEALRRGLPVVDGIDLLVAQAAAAFSIWTGIAAPVLAMMQAARRA
jgi:shikimate dehydrogenase